MIHVYMHTHIRRYTNINILAYICTWPYPDKNPGGGGGGAVNLL